MSGSFLQFWNPLAEHSRKIALREAERSLTLASEVRKKQPIAQSCRTRRQQSATCSNARSPPHVPKAPPAARQGECGPTRQALHSAVRTDMCVLVLGVTPNLPLRASLHRRRGCKSSGSNRWYVLLASSQSLFRRGALWAWRESKRITVTLESRHRERLLSSLCHQ